MDTLPVEIIAMIIARVPLQARRVCRRWCELAAGARECRLISVLNTLSISDVRLLYDMKIRREYQYIEDRFRELTERYPLGARCQIVVCGYTVKSVCDYTTRYEIMYQSEAVWICKFDRGHMVWNHEHVHGDREDTIPEALRVYVKFVCKIAEDFRA